MKYIKRFVSSLSDNVRIIENERSSSTYCVVDDTFVIRLSDHLSPSDARSGINVNVVSIWKGNDFIVLYKNTLNPMLMTRDKVKAYIEVCYTNWSLEKVTAESRSKWCKAGASLDGEEKYVVSMNEKYPTLKVYTDWSQLHSVLGSISHFKPIIKDVRKVIEIYYKEGKIDSDDILRLTFSKLNGKTSKEEATELIDTYVNEKKTREDNKTEPEKAA